MIVRVVVTSSALVLVRMVVMVAVLMLVRVIVIVSVRMVVMVSVRMVVMVSVRIRMLHAAVRMPMCSLALCEIVIDRFHDEYPFEPATHGWRECLSVPFEQV